jgi:hypothetical protein
MVTEWALYQDWCKPVSIGEVGRSGTQHSAGSLYLADQHNSILTKDTGNDSQGKSWRSSSTPTWRQRTDSPWDMRLSWKAPYFFILHSVPRSSWKQQWIPTKIRSLHGENLPQCRFLHHKPHMLPGSDPRPPRWEACDKPLELRHGPFR